MNPILLGLIGIAGALAALGLSVLIWLYIKGFCGSKKDEVKEIQNGKY